jgi:high-affinity K+ transport system ATPase subunit B
MNRMIQQVLVVTLAIFLIATASLVQAQEYASSPVEREITADAMLADLVLLRPLGIAATILGSAVFVASLPFTLPTRSVDKAAQKLVVEPGKFTFVRPLGQVPREYYP